MQERKPLSKEQIEEALERFPEQERQVLHRRLGLGEGRSRTPEEMSKEFQVTPEELRQLEAKLGRRLELL
jgi:DNA-directed RNA polymerase sigma subunit (sigma70/sigma32)